MNSSVSAEQFSAFDWAVVRLAVLAPAGQALPRLIFGSVSLLTNERPRPRNSADIDRFSLGADRGGTLLFRRIVLERARAVAWYRSASSEQFRTPVPTEQREVKADFDGQPIAVSDFLDDPRWPILGVATGADLLLDSYGSGDPAPFVGSGSAPARIHRRLGDNVGLKAVVADRNAKTFLKRRLFIDLEDYSEYLGGLALIVPNPLVRKVDHFFVPGTSAATERLVFRLFPRPGRSVEGMQLTVFERRANLLSRFETVEVGKKGLVELSDQAPVEASGYVVTHPGHGVLAYQPPLYFLRSIRTTINIAGQGRSSRQSADIGESTPVSARSRVAEAEIRRERRAQAQRYGQMWVDESNREAALLVITSRIFRAQSRVLISGPLIGSFSFLEFLLTFPKTDVAVVILVPGAVVDTIQSYARDPASDQSVPAAGVVPIDLFSSIAKLRVELQLMTEFGFAVAKLKEEKGINMEAVVVSDRSLPSYDALLAVDDSVWFLGGVFDGKRGRGASLMLMLPDGEPEILRHENLMAQSLPIDAYRAELMIRLEHYAPEK